ncbi:MAG: 5'-3' exonuclease H3TH domain-containing protein [bacterium]
MDKFFILDGQGLLYKAYYALPPLTDKQGMVVNAILGVSRMLLKLIKENSPEYIAICFDLPKPTFRHLKYNQYKIQRKKTPSELISQILPLKNIIKNFQIPIFELEGFEADDLIATLTEKTKKDLVEIIIISNDKDILQLVNEKVKVLFNKKGLSDLITYDLKKVIEEKKFFPIQFPDIVGLIGDQSDNIPGINGIGPKTALKLIKEYGSLEKIYENISLISPYTLKNNLINSKEIAFLSKELAILKKDVPIDFNLEECRFKGIDKEKLKDSFAYYNFNSLLPFI